MKEHDFDGKLVALEGIDNSGKTTAVDAIANWSDGRPDISVVTTAEPYGEVTDWGKPRLNACEFTKDRIKHVREIIEPVLRSGDIVVTDRYVGSSLAYQGSQDDGDIVEIFNENVPEPDLTIYIDVPVDVSLERGDNDVSEDVLRDAKRAYERMYDPCDPSVRLVDGTVSAAHTRHVAINAVKGLVTEEIRDSDDGEADESRTYSDAVEEIRDHIEENEEDYRKMGDV